LANLLANSSSVSPVCHKNHFIQKFVGIIIKHNFEYQGDENASSEGSLCAEQNFLVDQSPGAWQED